MAQQPNMGQLMKQVQQMQAEMAKAQEELKQETVEASGELLTRALRGLTGQSPSLEYRLSGDAAETGGLPLDELLTRLKEEFGATELGLGQAGAGTEIDPGPEEDQ